MADTPLSEQNRMLLQEITRRTNQMAAINVVTSAVGQSLDIDRTLSVALDVALEIVNAQASGISLIDEAAGELVLRAQRGWIQDFVVTNPMRIPMGQGLSGEVIARDDVIVYNRLDGSEPYAVPSFRDEHFRSIAMAPMHARGRITGILSIMSHEPDRFDDEVVNVLRVVADMIGVSLDNARLYSKTDQQKQRLGAVLDSTADGIIATDTDGFIDLVNPAAEALLGVNERRLLGRPLREAAISPTIRDGLLRALASRAANEDKAFQVTLPDERVIAAAASPVVNVDPVQPTRQQDGWVIVLRDVTHLRREEIARAHFMQAAAHDMRNPLSVTQSAVVTLQKLMSGDDATAAELIDLALNGIERLNGLIDDVLNLEQLESGQDLHIQRVNLLDLLQEVNRECFMLFAEKGITLTTVVAPDLPDLAVDVRWVKRALHNYLGNAAKYTPPQGAVRLYAQRTDDQVHFEVQDDGPGIPIAAQARLFDRFYRVQGTRSSGSGLGLAIVKSVAQAHGGDVYVRSAPGAGSTFGLVLPVHDEAHALK